MSRVAKVQEKQKKESTCFGEVEFPYRTFQSVPFEVIKVMPERCFEKIVRFVFAKLLVIWLASRSQNLQLLQFRGVFNTKDVGAEFVNVKDHNALSVFLRWLRIMKNQLRGCFDVKCVVTKQNGVFNHVGLHSVRTRRECGVGALPLVWIMLACSRTTTKARM